MISFLHTVFQLYPISKTAFGGCLKIVQSVQIISKYQYVEELAFMNFVTSWTHEMCIRDRLDSQ